MGKNRSSALPTMGEDVTGTTFEAENRENVNIPQNLKSINGIDWNKVRNDYDFGEDELEFLSNCLTPDSNGQTIYFDAHYFESQDIIDAYNNGTLDELYNKLHTAITIQRRLGL